jgi:hypothetical protein
MDQAQRVWRKQRKENVGSAEISGFQKQAGAILSTFPPAPRTAVISGTSPS